MKNDNSNGLKTVIIFVLLALILTQPYYFVSIIFLITDIIMCLYNYYKYDAIPQSTYEAQNPPPYF